MERKEFEQLVSAAVHDLPGEFSDRLENTVIVVQDWPSIEQLHKAGIGPHQTLLGLYEGVPLTRRGQGYGMVPPDVITIFQKPVELKCVHDDARITEEIARVVKHEIAHHFGISDKRLKELNGY